MFLYFYYAVQDAFKITLIPIILCALFRLAFILYYAPNKQIKGQYKKWRDCFVYGFWWGMDINSYFFLLMVLAMLFTISITNFLVAKYVALTILIVYSIIIYAAFFGKMIFYYHFNDIYNISIKIGKNVDKKNILDIFFFQNHGAFILIGLFPFSYVVYLIGNYLVGQLYITMPVITNSIVQYIFDFAYTLGFIALYYYCRYGGHFSHGKKPEWDWVPVTVKEDSFFSKAVIDDLVNLKLIYKMQVNDIFNHSEDVVQQNLEPLYGEKKLDLYNQDSLFAPFKRYAKGAKIQKPKKIFFIVVESYGQAPLDHEYEKLHISDRGKEFNKDEHTFSIENFLPAGIVSQPAITSLISGIYDNFMEINERQAIRQKKIPTSMPEQMKALGYKTYLSYGGDLSWASLGMFAKDMGFDYAVGGFELCGKKAPATFLGVYDHLYLEGAYNNIVQQPDDEYSFHFLYTTSNHGPYKIPISSYGFDKEKVFADMPERLKKDNSTCKDLGTYWYCDHYVGEFIDKIRSKYKDALIIVTGDHSRRIIPFSGGYFNRSQPSIREQYCALFGIYHQALKKEWFNGNMIGCHMNIMPTIIDLIAPAGFEYYSIDKSLIDSIDCVVTPEHWMTNTLIGNIGEASAQLLYDSKNEYKNIAIRNDKDNIGQAYVELTAWLIRYPEVLD